jgi:hypothetical protein
MSVAETSLTYLLKINFMHISQMFKVAASHSYDLGPKNINTKTRNLGVYSSFSAKS